MIKLVRFRDRARNAQGLEHLNTHDEDPVVQRELATHVGGVFNPAVSRKQRQMFAIAEHHPGELYARNRGALSMSRQQLHDFAATKGLKK